MSDIEIYTIFSLFLQPFYPTTVQVGKKGDITGNGEAPRVLHAKAIIYRYASLELISLSHKNPQNQNQTKIDSRGCVYSMQRGGSQKRPKNCLWNKKTKWLEYVHLLCIAHARLF